MSSLANRISTIFPIPDVAIKIKKTKPPADLGDGIASITSVLDDQGTYDIIFEFTKLKIECVHTTNTINLSNSAIQKIVEAVMDSFHDMWDEMQEERNASLDS